MKKIISGGTGEFTDKKSRFIANIYHIEDEDMAVKIIEQLRKKYWDARHNCYAYVLGGKSEIQRFSDDGDASLCWSLLRQRRFSCLFRNDRW